MTLLNVNQLHFAYGDRTIFDQVSFDLEPGQIMTILGPNGVGKSTLLSCLTNQLKEANGQININDRPLDSWTPKDLAQHMALVPQDYRSGAGQCGEPLGQSNQWFR
ncbi:ATP-binding cassette domain-containing protein, partial [Limosilactobacillus fermentum]|uniref:ATP-binding cassette domain-containing protein n=1 Tax=Limosilactobacillus fermentum TaxID=1613 RepID=UPI003EBCAD87